MNGGENLRNKFSENISYTFVDTRSIRDYVKRSWSFSMYDKHIYYAPRFRTIYLMSTNNLTIRHAGKKEKVLHDILGEILYKKLYSDDESNTKMSDFIDED